MRSLGIILAVAGLLTLLYGGFTYTKHREVFEVGPITTTVDEKKTVPISPIAGTVALIVGVALLISDRRRA